MNVSFTFTCPLPAVTWQGWTDRSRSFICHLTATESLSCFKQLWQGGYRHKSPYCVVYLLSQVFTWFELFVAFCVLYFVSSAEANYVAFSVNCFELWPFCATPTVGLQRHLLEKWTKWLKKDLFNLLFKSNRSESVKRVELPNTTVLPLVPHLSFHMEITWFFCKVPQE